MRSLKGSNIFPWCLPQKAIFQQTSYNINLYFFKLIKINNFIVPLSCPIRNEDRSILYATTINERSWIVWNFCFLLLAGWTNNIVQEYNRNPDAECLHSWKLSRSWWLYLTLSFHKCNCLRSTFFPFRSTFYRWRYGRERCSVKTTIRDL